MAALSAVALSAVAAHLPMDAAASAMLRDAVQMQGWHALALLFTSRMVAGAPRLAGIAGWAFVLGLACDVHQVSFLGQHALAYTVQGFLATLIHRRLLWFSVPSQALQVLPLFALSHAISMVLRMSLSGSLMGWPMLFAPMIEAMLWPVVSIILLAPQRRAPNPDLNRPL